jgi:predicted PhzF superfamily epimerase YddE/YHI9
MYIEKWLAKTASGKKRLMIEVASVNDVLRLEAELIRSIDHQYDELESYFVYAVMDSQKLTYYGRMFAPKLGILEDPVNGNSCIALASKLMIRDDSIREIKFYQNRKAHLSIEIRRQTLVLKAECHLATLTELRQKASKYSHKNASHLT